MTLFEEIIKELKNIGLEKDAERWIKSFEITEVEKRVLIYHLVYELPYKTISYNKNNTNICIDLNESNLSRLQKQAIKSATKYLKSFTINDLRKQSKSKS